MSKKIELTLTDEIRAYLHAQLDLAFDRLPWETPGLRFDDCFCDLVLSRDITTNDQEGRQSLQVAAALTCYVDADGKTQIMKEFDTLQKVTYEWDVAKQQSTETTTDIAYYYGDGVVDLETPAINKPQVAITKR